MQSARWVTITTPVRNGTKKPANSKTWQTFKRFFAAEYHDLKEQQKVNASQNNFHGANAAQDITQALDNLALAATTDRVIVLQLTTSNQQLTNANKLLTEQLQQVLATNATLVTKLGTQTAVTPPGNNNHRGGRKPFNQAEWESKLNPDGYCWTHGYRVQHGHSSQNCKCKMGGHQYTATRNNTQGGSTKGKA